MSVTVINSSFILRLPCYFTFTEQAKFLNIESALLTGVFDYGCSWILSPPVVNNFIP